MNALTRLVGAATLLIGSMLSVLAVIYWQDPSYGLRIAPAFGGTDSDALYAAMVCLFIGTLFVLVDPYRPGTETMPKGRATPRTNWTANLLCVLYAMSTLALGICSTLETPPERAILSTACLGAACWTCGVIAWMKRFLGDWFVVLLFLAGIACLVLSAALHGMVAAGMP